MSTVIWNTPKFIVALQNHAVESADNPNNNKVTAAIHHRICQHYETKTKDNIWLHKPNPVTQDNKVKVLWDFEMRTDRQIQACRLDLVVTDKQTKDGLIIDVAIPNDTHIVENEREKIEKYQDLRLEI